MLRHPQHHAPHAHPVETAGRHMVRAVPRASGTETAADVLRRLPGTAHDYAGAIYLVDGAGRLEGIVPMHRLLAAAPESALASLARLRPPAARADMDQEHVASLALYEEVAAMPVVDDDGTLLGVVPPQALIEILRHEHVEDLHRLAGITRENTRARHAIEAPPVRRARDRLPWLLVGLAGSVAATIIVARFEQALQSQVAIAFFIPGIVYLADAIGTQTETIAVRGLSLSRVPIAALIAAEIRTGLIIGLTLAVLAFLPIWWWFGDVRLAGAIAIALLAAGALASAVGMLFPWALSRLGRDPAYGSGPIATIVQDLLSLLIYFLTITALVL